LAMSRAVEALDPLPGFVRVDGNRLPVLAMEGEAVVGGDRLVVEISAASILAKEARDREMLELHHRWPEYGFDRHKGYPTADHLQALRLHGPTPEHRRSFRPVRELMGRRGTGSSPSGQ
ncbi:MAG TPA: ribonuclease HII, partial [Thiotrichales bacterium]|nr:ribonuclease HII [Thiotrichales bacterium]